MKKIIARIISIVLFCAILCGLLSYAYSALRWKDTTEEYFSSFDQLYGTDKGLIDVVFVGSSHCYDSAYPAFFWENAGISAFDMAVSAQDRDSAYHHLKELLKDHDPKVVFLEVYGLTYNEQLLEGNTYRNILSMKSSLNSFELAKDYFGRYGDKKDIPDYVFRFPILHTRYRELQRKDYITYAPNEYVRGEHVTWDTEKIEYYGSFSYEYSPAQLEDSQVEWLDKMCALSREEGFDLILYAAPYQTTIPDQAFYDAATEYASEHGIKMIDFNRNTDISFDLSTDFLDVFHTNASGAKKIADYLTPFLKENYDLTDHRGDARYHQWDEDLAYVNRIKDIKYLNTEEDPNAFFERLAQMDDVTVVLSLEEVFGWRYFENFYDSFALFGISNEDCEKGGKWVVCNGEGIKVNDNDPSQAPYFLELGKHDTLRVQYVDTVAPENIMIGTEGYSAKNRCLLVLIYDHTTDEVVAERRF